jgi:hypothetical protein
MGKTRAELGDHVAAVHLPKSHMNAAWREEI